MARQSTSPVQFNRSIRKDTAVLMSSGRAGVVQPVAFIPLLAGDSASGRVGVDVQLKEMPKPLLNGATANFQAWFVPKSAHPQFSGIDELQHARTGDAIKALGSADRTPPAFFSSLTTTQAQTFSTSAFGKALGLHVPTGGSVNTDLLDAFSLIYNFRLAAHSSRLSRRKYTAEDFTEVCSLPSAFWPSSRFAAVVPDYERALVVGSLDLDVAAGRLPISGIGVRSQYAGAPVTNQSVKETGQTSPTIYPKAVGTDGVSNFSIRTTTGTASTAYADIWAEMDGQTIGVSLADIDKARTTQSFAKLRTAYSGNDATGFDNDDTIVALLMQGISVPADQFKRPWLLDSKRVPIGFAERFASDGASLDKSVTLGRASAQLSLNVPVQDVSGVIIVTCEVLPERIDERMSDEWLLTTDVNTLPNALRDVQRIEPVDMVLNRRVDAKHSTPNGLYGYEPMNNLWNRDFTRLGGDFYMATPGGGWTENRSAIWQTEIVNPTFSAQHFLAPSPFPHDVFADQNADAFEVVCRHQVAISGLTQIGDVLAENNDDYAAIEGA